MDHFEDARVFLIGATFTVFGHFSALVIINSLVSVNRSANAFIYFMERLVECLDNVCDCDSVMMALI